VVVAGMEVAADMVVGAGLEAAAGMGAAAGMAALAAAGMAALAAAGMAALAAADMVAAVVAAGIDFGKARGIAGPGRTEDLVVILRGGTGGRLAQGIPDTVTGALTAITWIQTGPASSAQAAN